MLILNIILIFISTVLLIYSLISLVFVSAKPNERLRKYFDTDETSNEKEKKELNIKLQPRKLLNGIGEKIGGIMLMKRYIQKIQEELIKAGLPLKGEEFLAIQVLIFSGIILLTLNSTQSFLLSFVIAVLGWLVSMNIIKLRKNKRYKLFNEQLGDSIVLISNSLKAGHSFLQAIDSVASEMPEPISKEFEKVLREMRLGVETEKALENLLKRVESDDLELMVTAVLIQRQIGGNLSEILDNISNTIRERVSLKGEIRALTAQGRLSGIIVSLLPVGLAGILYIINPDYSKDLIQNEMGLVIIGIAIINQIIGIIIINKIVKIEV